MRDSARRWQAGHGHERRHHEEAGNSERGVESVDVRVHGFLPGNEVQDD